MIRNFFNRNRRTASQETAAPQFAPVSASTSGDPGEFGGLGQSLQQELHRLVAQANRLQIRCAVREGILLVLTEHLLHVEPDPQHTFIVLEQSVRELVPKLLEADLTSSPTAHSRPLPVRLYLRVAGYQQPYAFHSFTLAPAPVTAHFSDVDTRPVLDSSLEVDSPPETGSTFEIDSPPEVDSPPELNSLPHTVAPAEPASTTWSDAASATPEAEVHLPLATAWLDATTPEVEAPSSPPDATAEPEIESVTSTEPIAPSDSTAAFTIITDADAFMAEPIAPELSPNQPATAITPEVETPALPPPEAEPIEDVLELEAQPAIVAEPAIDAQPFLQEAAAPEAEAPVEPFVQFQAAEIEEPIAEDLLEVAEPEAVGFDVDGLEATPQIEAVNLPEPVSEEIASEELASEELSEATVNQDSFELPTPELAAESTSAVYEATIEPAIAQPTLAEIIEPPSFDDITTEPELILEQPVLEQPIPEQPVAEEIEPSAFSLEADAEAANPEIAEFAEFIEEAEQTTELPIAGDEMSTAPVPDIDPSFAETVDDFEYSSIADIEISDHIEGDSAQEIEQESADEYLVENETPPESRLTPTEPEQFEPFRQDFSWQHEDTEVTQTTATEYEPTIEPLASGNFSVEQTDSSIHELAVDETELDTDPDREIDSFIAPEITTARPIETTNLASVESVQDQVNTIYEDSIDNDSEFAIAWQSDTVEDATENIENTVEVEARTNHAIAPPSTPEPILPVENGTASTHFDQADQADPVDQADQVRDSSNYNGSAASPLTIESAPVEVTPVESVPVEIISDLEGKTSQHTENVIQPIRLIPTVQDSASSFDRLPLELGDVGRKPFRSRLTLFNVLLTGAVGLFFVVGGVYVLTRPCVLNRQCQPLQQSQRLAQTALTTIQTNASALEVVDAYDQLKQADLLLETIPFWSSHYQEAQTLKTEYASKAAELSLVVKALNQANVAAKKSLSPPHPISVWREVQLTWRESISQLEQVSTDSSVYALAQNKHSEYQANLESINSRILVEQNALDRLEAVKKAAEVTDARSQIVNTIDSWQQTSDSWKTILEQLKQIPQGTMAYQEAERLTRLYQLKLEDSDNRRSQEVRSATAYNQAIGFAVQARGLDQQGQWSEAIDHWRQAITTIKQVPEATTYSDQAQTLLNSYMTSLSQSEQSLKQATLMQTVEPQLERICSGSYSLCTYTLTTEAIRVQITSEYNQVVVQALRSIQLNQNAGNRAATGERVNQFLQSLASISKTAQVPVELYSAAGVRLGTYDLNQSGYILP